LVCAKRCATCASAGGAPGGNDAATGTLHAEDDAICYERTVTVIADDGDALTGGRRGACRKDFGSVLEVDRLLVTIAPYNREPIGMKVVYASKDNVVPIVVVLVP